MNQYKGLLNAILCTCLCVAASGLELPSAPGIARAYVADSTLGAEGYRIVSGAEGLRVEAAGERGMLYGLGAAARMRTMGRVPADTVTERPAYALRVLNHWDNLDGTVERGYAGPSIWDWQGTDPGAEERWRRYGRICASTGINGAVLNNVNASSQVLSGAMLRRVAHIADVLRDYGVRVYLSANFAAPMQLGGLPTADPEEPAVAAWWAARCDTVYSLIPDFGGLLVKANSEGQPGPCDYGRSHACGANMLARAIAPHGGVVMWRAFVYSPGDADRAKQAYLEFEPLDGQFDDNVIVQIKNGPIDFQPREPHSPLFGAMPRTRQMVEFQITQEYLGHSNHVAYLAPMWSEFFEAVAPESLCAVAGVANTGACDNLTGHPLAMANWYAFGRLAWNPRLSPAEILDEWLRCELLTRGDVPAAVTDSVRDMMLGSREAVVDYMMPLGLHHIFAFGHHYGPEPWCEVEGAREDWLPRYYHRADTAGLGFERGPAGSDATSQYGEPWRSMYASADSCPEELLLWFHHVPWDRPMRSGRTLWDELCLRYQRGCDATDAMLDAWRPARPYVEPDVYADVEARLDIQRRDARWWRDACLQYFGRYSRRPLPEGVEPPAHTLEQLMRIHLPISNFEAPTGEMLMKLRE